MLGYQATFTGDKVNFSTTDNPALFNIALDQYEVTEEGNFAFEVRITLPVGQVLNGPILSLYEDGIQHEQVLFSGADYAGGQYIFVFQRSYTALQIGTKVDFRFSMQGPAQSVQVSNLSFVGRKLIGVNLIQFSAITDLAGHVPDLRFSEFLMPGLRPFSLHLRWMLRRRFSTLTTERMLRLCGMYLV